MVRKKYGIIKPKAPMINLLEVPHQRRGLTVTYDTFGPAPHNGNLGDISGWYTDPRTGRNLDLIRPTTSESISAAAYKFVRMGKDSPPALWLGEVLKTSEGVFVNPPVREKDTLKSTYLNLSEKVRGIHLLDQEDFAFAPYETFKEGAQTAEDFVLGGLARALEHTRGRVARNLRALFVHKYEKPVMVDVYGFDKKGWGNIVLFGAGRNVLTTAVGVASVSERDLVGIAVSYFGTIQ